MTLALADIATGDTVAARARRSEFEGADDWFAVGVVTAALGDADAAFAAFDRVETWDRYWPALAGRLLYQDALGPLRADPRYQEILRRLAQAWNTAPVER